MNKAKKACKAFTRQPPVDRDYQYGVPHLEERREDELSAWGAVGILFCVMLFITFIVGMFMSTGAAAAEAAPFVSAEIRHQFDLQSSENMQRGENGNAQNPGSTLAAGIEFRTSAASHWRYTVMYVHRSNPFERKAREDYSDSMAF